MSWWLTALTSSLCPASAQPAQLVAAQLIAAAGRWAAVEVGGKVVAGHRLG